MSLIDRLSSRQRLTLQVTGGLLVLWFAIGALTLHAVEHRVYASVDRDLTSQLAQVARAVEVLPDDQLRGLAAAADSTRDTALLIVGPDGVDFSQPSGRVGGADPLPDLGHPTAATLRPRAGEPFTVDAVRGPMQYRVVTSPLADGRVLVRAEPLTDAHQIVHDLRAVLVLACVATILGAIALVWLIGRQALRPLEAIITTARQVGDGTFDARVDVSSTAPDVVHLADALNVMLTRLHDELGRRERTEGHLRQFVADASHELRTPLAAIIGFGELYQQHTEASGTGTGDEARDRMVGRMLVEAGRMQSLVEELLTLARLDEGLPLARDQVDLTALVAAAVGTIGATNPSHHFVVAVEPVTVVGDANALRQVIDNLLANVVAHTPAGTTAEVRVGADGDEVVLRVTDDGPGLSPADASRAFQRFWRATPDRGRPGGTGLGLAIVAEITRAHGGRATVDAADDGGLALEVRLPAARAAVPAS